MFGALITAHDDATQNNIPLKPHEYVAPLPTDNPALKSYVQQPIAKAAFRTKRNSEATSMNLTNRLKPPMSKTVHALPLEETANYHKGLAATQSQTPMVGGIDRTSDGSLPMLPNKKHLGSTSGIMT